MRKFDLSLRSSRSSYFATFRHQLTILSKTDALDEEKWLNMLGTFVKDWFRLSRNATSLNSRFKSLDTLKVKIISVTFRRVIRTNHKKASKIWRHENIQLGG